MEYRYIGIWLLFYFNSYGKVWASDDLCATSYDGHNINCDKQLFGNNYLSHTEGCSVVYYPTNSSQCFSKEFFDTTNSDVHLGEVTLKPYFKSYGIDSNYTQFNVTLTGIKWRSFSFRFQLLFDDNEEPLLKNHCRDINIVHHGLLPNSSTLFYDCLWSHQEQNYAGKSYMFQYHALNGSDAMSGKYIFQVPPAAWVDPEASIMNWRPFMYVEIKTDKLVLHIVEAPQKLNITSYEIKAYERDRNTLQGSSLLDAVTLNSTNGELVYEISPGFKDLYYFDVTPSSENCPGGTCDTVKSPTVEQIFSSHSYVICIASTASLVAALLLFVIFLIKRFYPHKFPHSGNDILLQLVPYVLIIYTPVSKIHADIVALLADCLREIGIIVAYDKDIDRTYNEDPFEWCKEEYDKANCVLYVVSPTIKQIETVAVHRYLDIVPVNLLKYSMADRNMNKKVLSVTFDYCAGGKALFLGPNFRLPDQWNKMVEFVCKDFKMKGGLVKTEAQKVLLGNLLLSINRANYYLKMNDSFGDDVQYDDTNILIRNV